MPIATINPTTGEQIESFTPLSAAEIDDKVRVARGAFESWSRKPASERARVVGRVAELLEQRTDDYARVMTLEMGKIIGGARDEVTKCAFACRHYAEHGPAMLEDQVVATANERGYVAFHPLGVVLAVMPWNFPFWQVIRFAAPALVAGNVALLKHASNVPHCALALERLFLDAGALEGVFQTLLIGSDAVASLLGDDRIAAATLTGSEGAGSSVASEAGRHIKKTVLELGGSDPFIIMPSADMDAAVDTAVRARIINSGQSCIAAKRFIVHERIADDFEKRFVQAMQSLVVGDPTDPQTHVGPLAARQLVVDLERQVNESVQRGATLLTGGKPLARRGFFFEPTVLANIPRDAPAFSEELFGPVASVFRADDAADAIRIANDSRFGLGASVWTTEVAEAARFARELEVGAVFVNGMVASDPRYPFGGVKKSGYGRELSGYGLREFVNIKMVRMFGLEGGGLESRSTLAE